MNLLDKIVGGFLGLAIGDALSSQIELKRKGTLCLRPGVTSDDTEMARLMAQSLIEKGVFDPEDMMKRVLSWYFSPDCLSLDITIREALERFQFDGEPFQGIDLKENSGNCYLMRLLPAIVFSLHADDDKASELAWAVSRLTHSGELAKKTTSDLTALIRRLLRGENKEDALRPYRVMDSPVLTGVLEETFDIAIWGFANSETFEEGLLKVVNLSADCDTSGAIYGQIAGCYYGRADLPKKFLSRLQGARDIEELAKQLFAMRGPGDLESTAR